MRTSRVFVASILSVTMLTGSTVGVVAQSEESAAPARPEVITGEQVCGNMVQGVDATDSHGGWHGREWRETCKTYMSDPRVSGTFNVTVSRDCYQIRENCVYWGTSVMEEPDGGWDCSWTGTSDPTGRNRGHVLAVCPGTGPNKGLTYVYQRVFWGSGDVGNGTSFHGLVYAGEPPPWGPLSAAE